MNFIRQIATLAVLCIATSLAGAADSKTGVMHLPLKGTVVAITPHLLTLKGGTGKPDRKFTINKGTKILRGTVNALTDDVRVNQIVTGSYVRNTQGADTLTKLQIAPPPPKRLKKEAAKTVTTGQGKGGGGSPAKKGDGKGSKGSNEAKNFDGS